MSEEDVEYKRYYSGIFSFFYIVEGLHNGLWGTTMAFYLITQIQIQMD